MAFSRAVQFCISGDVLLANLGYKNMRIDVVASDSHTYARSF